MSDTNILKCMIPKKLFKLIKNIIIFISIPLIILLLWDSLIKNYFEKNYIIMVFYSFGILCIVFLIHLISTIYDKYIKTLEELENLKKSINKK